jgi:hypothetical protein
VIAHSVRQRFAFGLLATAFAVVVDGCDARITDPGPVDDESLNQPLANAAIVNGMAKSFSRALGYVSYTGAAISREVVASGSMALFGITVKQRAGLLDPATNETNDHWQFSQQARWVAEDGVRRMRVTLGDKFGTTALAAEALVYVGYTNRLLGENMCDGVIDGGPIEPRTVYFTRAQAAFGEAMTIAAAANSSKLELAARAGRASVRVWLGDWTGAVADAKLVPSSFVHQAKYTTAELDQYNRIFWANSNQPYRAHSEVGTFYESYYLATNDPRTPWKKNPAIPNGTQANVPWYFQTKFDKRESPVNLASGHEMRLIVAESLLRSGDWEGALNAINQLRSEVGVVPWTASNSTEAWVALKRERGIELWLEGRRLGDLGRWVTGNTPGAVEDMTGRNTCFPIGQTEREANPNF